MTAEDLRLHYGEDNLPLRRLAAWLWLQIGCCEIGVGILKPDKRPGPPCVYTVPDLRRSVGRRLREGCRWPFVGMRSLRMAFALAKENVHFISRMLRMGRFNNQSEVVREALRRMEREEAAYLNPAPMSGKDARRIYASHPEEDARELALAKGALRALRTARKRTR